MAFPTSAVLDNFNRANEGPPPSANWTTAVISGHDGLKVVANECQGHGADNSAWWNAASFGPDMEARIRLNNPGVDGAWMYLYARLQDPGTATPDGYALRVDRLAGTDTVKLYRLDNGAHTQLGATHSVELGIDDEFGIECIGTAIKAYRKPSGGAWAEVISATDATYQLAGRAGLYTRGGTMDFDDFGAGTIAGGDTQAPVAATNLTLTPLTPTQLEVAWTNPPDADTADYMVRRSTVSAPATTADGDLVAGWSPATPSAAVSLTDTGLTNGTRYFYSVFTRDAVPNVSAPASASGVPYALLTRVAPSEVDPVTAGPYLVWGTPAGCHETGRPLHFRVEYSQDPAFGVGSLVVAAASQTGALMEYESAPGVWTALPATGLAEVDVGDAVRNLAASMTTPGTWHWRPRVEQV